MNKTPNWYLRERTIFAAAPPIDHITVEAVLFVNGPDGWEERGRRTARVNGPDFITGSARRRVRQDLIERYLLDDALELTEEEVAAGDY